MLCQIFTIAFSISGNNVNIWIDNFKMYLNIFCEWMHLFVNVFEHPSQGEFKKPNHIQSVLLKITQYSDMNEYTKTISTINFLQIYVEINPTLLRRNVKNR